MNFRRFMTTTSTRIPVFKHPVFIDNLGYCIPQRNDRFCYFIPECWC